VRFLSARPDAIKQDTSAAPDDQQQKIPPDDEVPPPRKPRRRWLWLALFLILFLGAIYLGWRYYEAKEQAAKRANTPPPAISVVAERAQTGQIPVYINGLGAVTPIYTVSVNSRVDGQLLTVNYTEGQIVHQGDLLVEIDPRPYQVMLTQYEGMLIRDQALLDNAHIDLERYRTLVAHNAVPEQTFATQQALVKQYEGNVKTDQGQIDSAKLDLVYCRITAPITGRVGLRLVDPGNIVAANSSVMAVITQVEPISVIFTIGEDQLAAVRKRMASHLEVDALDRTQKNRIAQGVLQTIDNQIDPTTGTVRLRANFPNKDDALFPDQFVNARLLLQMKRNVVLVPNAAIQRNGSTTYVWVVQSDQTVQIRNVTEGTVGPDYSQIESGLSAGETVVTDGVDRLQPGSKVNAQITAPKAGRKAGG
jgi:multidrug efflux system membrane fusion protein